LYKEYKEEEKKVLDRLCKKNTLIIKKEQAHDNRIYCCISAGTDKIISVGIDKKMKMWN
jgi:Ethanolamine utilization protein EutJ (predicted chaperonin)